jgi:UDP-glucose:(heptosyl)LPS alpha-1,3-glucosyltransferase
VAIETRLKIAFVVDRFGARFGGAESYGVALMRELARTCDITVFAREYDESCDLRLPFVSLRSWSGWPSWIRVLLFAIRARRRTRHGFDIVHSHMNGWCGDIDVIHVTPVRYNWRVRRLPFLKRALSRVSLRVQTYLRLEARRVAPRAGHRTVAVSHLIADQLRQAYGPALSAPVIPPGVSVPDSRVCEQRQPMRSSLGWEEEDYVCLMVARNPLRKGLSTALEALFFLPARFKLLVVGADSTARDFVHKAHGGVLADRVRLISETSDVAPYYVAADLYVHPTLNDSFGMAPLEAMSFGLPVVLSPEPWCGFAHYVQDKSEAMLLSHPEDATQLARFIGQISQDGALRTRLAQGGSQVVKRHGWTGIASQYRGLYEQVISER